MSQPEVIEATAGVPPAPRAKLHPALVFLIIMATVYAVASFTLGVVAYQTSQHNAKRIEQLQIDTNDNLCNQQAYQGGTTCVGGDANGGGILP